MNKVTSKVMISPAEVNRLRQDGESFLLIDVLPKTRYQHIHLPGAENACVYEVTFLQQVAEITADREQRIILYGDSATTHDAGTAADKLQRDGYKEVMVLDGGLEAWQATGYPVEESAETAEQTAPQPADGVYQVDTEQSTIEWAGRNPATTHHGTLKLQSGQVRVEAGEISGRFVIDMNSIENVNLAGDELKTVLEEHLKSDDFFFVKRFSEARFEMTAKPLDAVQPASAPNYSVNGTLHLCGVAAKQEFTATIVPTEEGKLRAVAHFDFDRTRWGVIYGSTKFFKHLGMHLVFDLISLQLRIVTR